MSTFCMRFRYIDISYRLFVIYIFICAFLPSGNLFNIPVKSLFFFPSLFVLLIAISSGGIKYKKSAAFATGSTLSLIVLYTMLGIFNGFDYTSVLTESKLITMFTLMVILASLFADNVGVTKVSFDCLKSAIIGSFSFALLKTFLFFGLMFSWFDYSFVSDKVYKWLGYEPVGLAIELGGSRFSFVTLDFISICLFGFYLLYRTKLTGVISTKKFAILYAAFFLVSLFSAYSRALFLITPIILLYVMIIKRSWSLIILVLMLSFAVAVYNHEALSTIIEQRFMNQGHSDSWRYLMIDNLLYFWNESAFLGWGIGAYIPWLIRDANNMFSYEVQFISMFMKFGLSFALFYVILNVILVKASLRNINISFIYLVFILWSVLSFTNQYLFNTTVGVLAVVMLLLFRYQCGNER